MGGTKRANDANILIRSEEPRSQSFDWGSPLPKLLQIIGLWSNRMD